MEAKTRIIILSALFSMMHVQGVCSCSCAWMPPRSAYCKTQYAIRARILSETSSETEVPEGVSTTTESWIDSMNKYVEYTYEIEIEDVYRSTPLYETAEKKIVSTGLKYCITRLEPGKTYLLLGWVSRSTLSLSCFGTFDLSYDGNRRVVEGLTNNPPRCNENRVGWRNNNNNNNRASSFWQRTLFEN